MQRASRVKQVHNGLYQQYGKKGKDITNHTTEIYGNRNSYTKAKIAPMFGEKEITALTEDIIRTTDRNKLIKSQQSSLATYAKRRRQRTSTKKFTKHRDAKT